MPNAAEARKQRNRMIGLGLLPGLKARPRLLSSLTLGIATAGACAFLGKDMAWHTCAVIGWDVTCAVFISAVLWMMRGKTPDDMQATAATQDDGAVEILGLVLLGTAFSIYAVASELSAAKTAAQLEKALSVGLALGTVALSWLMVQLTFCLHYAHGYYGARRGPGGKKAIAGGLNFPGDDPTPDYWDFLHFSIVIGVACQTADVMFTSQHLRRVGTTHSLIAFAFNTVILAFSINILAGMIS